MLIAFGDNSIKQLPNGKIGGLLVRFSSDKDPDLAGEFFTKATDFNIEDGAKTPLYFNHRMPLPLPRGGEVVVKEKIGEGKLFKNDDGILIEAILYNRKKYEKALLAMGWSSGTASHLVDKEKVGKAYHIKTWPLGLDASITPEPCEPRNGVYDCKSVKFAPIEDNALEPKPPAKSLAARLTQFIDDSVDDGHAREDVVKRLAREALMDAVEVEKILKGETTLRGTAHIKAFARVLEVPYETLKALADNSEPRTIKGMFEDELANQQPGIWMLWDVFRCVVRRIAEAKASTMAAGTEFDDGPKVDEAVGEFVSRLKSSVVAQIADYASNDEDEFYLKTFELSSPEAFRSVTEQMPMEEHLRLVGTAEEDLVARLTANADRPHGKSYKAGRELSNKNRQRLMKLKQMHDDHHAVMTAKMQALIDETQPKAKPEEKRAAFINHQRTKLALQRLETGV